MLAKHYCFISLFLMVIFTVAGCDEKEHNGMKGTGVKIMDLSQYQDSKPERQIKLLFIHHSCGGQWLANKGEIKEIIPGTCLYETHPNGGGLRSLLQQNNYEVHEASYKSRIGDKTDVNDWNAKFRNNMKDILRCDRQDTLYTDATVKNNIVIFKSCFPNSAIGSEGKAPGDPDSPVKTTANYKAAYSKLLSYFSANPDTLFVCVTAPPLVESVPSRSMEFIKKLIGSESTAKAIGERNRRFNNWLKDTENGWLAGYDQNNVVVFDYYDLLTSHGKSNYSLYPTNSGNDSHPSAEGNAIAARDFIPFLNKALNRHVWRQ
jgi:hypothetical protein